MRSLKKASCQTPSSTKCYYDSLTASAEQITTTNTMIKQFDDHALYEWKVFVVPMFEELQTQLQATIAVLAE